MTLLDGLARLAVEYDSLGYAHREIGLDAVGQAIHRKPSTVFRNGDFGLLDGPPVDYSAAIDRGDAIWTEPAEFERLWLSVDAVPVRSPSRLKDWCQRVWRRS